jgi:hypothetical protein
MKNLLALTILALSASIVIARGQHNNWPNYKSKTCFVVSDTILIKEIKGGISLSNYNRKYRYKQDGYLSGLYLNMGLGKSNSLIMGIGLNLFYSNNWGGSLSCNYFTQRAVELPPDFYGGFTYLEDPTDHIVSYSVRLMREIPTSVDQIRFGIEGGVSMVQYQRAHFLYSPQGWFSLNSNYIVTYSKSNTLGLSFRAKAELPFTRIWGMELALISNINKYQSYVGCELHTTLGMLRD